MDDKTRLVRELELRKAIEDKRRLITFDLTDKQKLFINAKEDEVLYGGAAGGGKSYGQLIDAWIKAISYPGIKQLILRRTFPELKRSLIMSSLVIFKQTESKYNESDKKWKFNNGSMIEFGYCDSENDVTQYQSAEYDIIRFDELTHFTEFQYSYMISRIRGVNNFPKQIKSSTNPGSIGHEWVKRRFIENKIPQQVYIDDLERSSMFIPAKVQENNFLMDSDPKYITRLQQLGENERRALLEGDWDIFEGQYFSEFRKEIHSCTSFVIPEHWNRYRVLDYGLDMLACYWIALNEKGEVFVYKELYENNLIIKEAASRIKEVNGSDRFICTYAPPDLWNRRQETGKNAADIFAENGVPIIKSKNDRVNGWYSVKDWLYVHEKRDEHNGELKKTSNLKIFSNCINLIRTLPAIQKSESNPNDCATEPHELTHAPDALRYFCSMRTCKTRPVSNVVDELGIHNRFNSYENSITGGDIDQSYINY